MKEIYFSSFGSCEALKEWVLMIEDDLMEWVVDSRVKVHERWIIYHEFFKYSLGWRGK